MKIYDEAEIIKLYIENTCTLKDILNKFDLHWTLFYSILRRNNIQKRKCIVIKRKPHSEEYKQRHSATMKKVHAEGRHPGWCAVNSKKEDSYPEIVFLQYLKSSELSKYTILPKFPVSRYVLDYVIVEHKINIELDGQYHFNDQKTIDKDIKRNEYLQSLGWKVYRISWTFFNKNREAVINDLITFTNSSDIHKRSYLIDDYVFPDVVCKCGEAKYSTSIQCRKCYTNERISQGNMSLMRKFEVSKEELEILVKEKPMTEIGKMFGVSDNAVKKRCKKLGIELKPMRGHWRKVETGKI